MRIRNLAIIAVIAVVVVVVSGVGLSYAFWGDGEWCFAPARGSAPGRWCF